MASPRDARIAGAVTVLLVGGVVWNVAFQQDSARDRRRTVVPVGVHVPLPASQAEARRPQGPVTLSLAALIERGEGRAAGVAASPPSEAPSAPSRMTELSRSLEQLARSEPQAAAAPSQPAPAAGLVRDVQAALAARGYQPGPADGQVGPMTSAAILAFEREYGLPPSGMPTPTLLAALRAPGQPRSSSERLPQKRARVATGD